MNGSELSGIVGSQCCHVGGVSRKFAILSAVCCIFLSACEKGAGPGTGNSGAGQPASVTATAGAGQSTTISTAFTAALQATVKDASGNSLPSINVTFTAPPTGASGTFANGTTSTTSTTNSSGIATASAFTANGVSGSYSVTASVSGVSATAPFNLTNNSLPAMIALVSPSTGQPGQTISVTINGLNTNFLPGTTMVSLGSGISVGGAPEGALGPSTVTSPTSVSAQITIDPQEATGTHTVSVATGAQQESLASAFLVYHTGTTGADGSASFPADNLTITVEDISSQQPVPGIVVSLLNNGSKDGFWLIDPSGKYLPDFVDPSPVDTVTVFLQPVTSTILSSATQIGSDFANFMTAGDTVSEDNIQQVAISLGEAALSSYVQILELAACSAPPGALALAEINALLTQVANLNQQQCSSSGDVAGCYNAVDGILASAASTIANSGLGSSCQNLILNNVGQIPTIIGNALDKNSFTEDGLITGSVMQLAPFFFQGVAALQLYADGYRCFSVYEPSSSGVNPITNTLFPFLVQGSSTSPCGSPVTVPGLVTTTINGNVVDANTGAGIAGATVFALHGAFAGGFSVTTATDGTFSGSIQGTPGIYTIVAEAPGYISNTSLVFVFNETNQQVSPITIKLAPYSSGQPVITSVTPIVSQATQGIVITGSGFGNTPPQTAALGDGSVDTLACNVTTPSIAIDDSASGSDAWAAGRESCTNVDAIGVNIVSWTDTQIVLNGFGSGLGNAAAPGTWNIAPGDPLTILVFGPNNSGTASYNLQVSPATPVSLTGSVTLSIPSNQAWTDTGINLNVGDTVIISASGLVILTTDGHIPPMSPAGFPPNCTAAEVYGQFGVPFPAFDLPCWSLIGSIGANGAIFEVGTSLTFQAQTSGEFFLGMNDNNLGDNSGSWTASITVVH